MNSFLMHYTAKKLKWFLKTRQIFLSLPSFIAAIKTSALYFDQIPVRREERSKMENLSGNTHTQTGIDFYATDILLMADSLTMDWHFKLFLFLHSFT